MRKDKEKSNALSERRTKEDLNQNFFVFVNLLGTENKCIIVQAYDQTRVNQAQNYV